MGSNRAPLSTSTSRCAERLQIEFVAHEMKPDQPGSRHGVIKIAIDSLSDIVANVLDRVALRVNSIAQSTGGVAAIRFIFGHFEYDLAHDMVSAHCSVTI